MRGSRDMTRGAYHGGRLPPAHAAWRDEYACRMPAAIVAGALLAVIVRAPSAAVPESAASASRAEASDNVANAAATLADADAPDADAPDPAATSPVPATDGETAPSTFPFDWGGAELLAFGILPLVLIVTAAALCLVVHLLRRRRADRAALVRLQRQRPRLHARLERARRQLTEQRDLHERGAAERRQWRDSLRRARVRIERQDLLLASLGHEIRSPLRSLLAVVDLVDRDVDPSVRQQLRIVSDLTRHVLKVAEDSLELASMERGAATLEATRFELESELERALHGLGARSSRRVRLGVDFEPGMPMAWIGDAARLRQILINLVGNALDHTEHGAVIISFARPCGPGDEPGPGLVMTVRDSGTGIAPGAQSRIFEPFVQGAASGGLAGLGLSVVAGLTELMDGEIDVTSELGVGSCFMVTLPLAPAEGGFPAPVRRPGRTDADDTVAGHGEATAPPLCDQSCGLCVDHPIERHALAGYLSHWGARVENFPDPRSIEEHLANGARLDAVLIALDTLPGRLAQLTALRQRHPELRIIEAHGEAAGESFWPSALAAALGDPGPSLIPPPAPAPITSDARVLVVDDHPVARSVLLGVLAELGCNAIAADDGRSAIEIAEDPEEIFDCVLLDRQMPGLDGLTTAAALRSRCATRHARLVLLVNESGGVHPEQGLVDEILVRPAGIEALRAALLALLSTSAAGTDAATIADADLQRLRDETLSEDLDALLRALDADDPDAANAHMHRMQGALRICPEAWRCESLQRVQQQLEIPDNRAARASARQFRTLLEKDLRSAGPS